MPFNQRKPRNEPLPIPPELSVEPFTAPVPVPVEPLLCSEQQRLVDLIQEGRNVFYTGSAGCGKSTVLKAAVKMLKAQGKTVHIVAPTGRAALQVEGVTTWSYMGWTPESFKLNMAELMNKAHRKHVKKRLRQTDVLVIDEISMVENHHLERMNICMKHVRSGMTNLKGVPAFGGVQLIVTGDFCQLPPVTPFQFCLICGKQMTPNLSEDAFDCSLRHGPYLEKDKWAFMSIAWEEARFVHFHLKEIHRQNDGSFIRMLQKCRLGIPFSPDETSTLMDHECNVEKATRLLCTIREVASVNRLNFNKLKTPISTYKALDGFDWYSRRHPELARYSYRADDGTLVACKEHRLETSVELRGGMLVMLQVNLNLDIGLVNGSQGIICGFEAFDPEKLPNANGGDYAELKEGQVRKFMAAQMGAKGWPRVLFHNGVKRTIYPTCTVNSLGDGEPYSLLHRTQVPLVAGWALSVHRSQGMTLDRVIVDLSRAFEEGQVYVALSRATSLQGLKIEGDPSGLLVGMGGNNEVQGFLKAKFGEALLDEDAPDEDAPDEDLPEKEEALEEDALEKDAPEKQEALEKEEVLDIEEA